MSVRHLLNGAAINGAMVIALLVGAATSSVSVAILVFIVCIGTSVASEQIRFKPRGKH